VRIDLHSHSTASDGTRTPAEVVERAANDGLDVLALTDHDSASGWPDATAAARLVGITLVRGMEISTKYDGIGVHLLAYLPDPTYPPLHAELVRILAGRDGRLTSMLAQLRAAGVEISEAEVLEQVGRSPAIGRPHIADVMVARGIVADRTEAFGKWLNPGRPGHVVRYATHTAAMIRLVAEAGGASVIAHPWGRGSRRVIDADTLGQFAAAGLAGLEVDHHDHSPDDRRRLRNLAADASLLVTGSSDYHGAGKTDHELGSNLTAPDQFERLLGAAAAAAASSGRAVPGVVGR
jgi:predicted metal-dependent phosphoesterase TrpH